jgi:optic atrophy 3 protein
MRLRLGLLQDPAVIDRQIAREVAEIEAKRAKSKPKIPTVKTEAEAKADEERVKQERKEIEKHVKAPPRIRPLSESKAIDTGANFISETFLFIVAGGIIVFENWRSRRKETSRREDVKERLDTLEREKEEMRVQIEELSALTEKLAELEAANTREGSGRRKSGNNGGTKAASKPAAPPSPPPSPPTLPEQNNP